MGSSLEDPVPIERTELADGTRVLRPDVPFAPWLNVEQARKLIADLQAGIEWVEQGA